METKLLVDLFITKLIDKVKVIQYFQSKLKTDIIENIEFYDIIYSDKLSNQEFINLLSQSCYSEIQENELENKYNYLLNFIYLKRNLIDVEQVLYLLYSQYKPIFLDIDFEFWTSLSTDYELKVDGFDGLSNFSKIIDSYLEKHMNTEESVESLFNKIVNN